MKRVRATAGFTLLELMMVVIIIAILASVALPQFLNTSERARASEAYNILDAIRGAEARFRALSPTSVYGALADLDVTLDAATLKSWGAPTITGAGTTTGFVTMTRTGSTGTIGLQFGSGTRCGTFKPEFSSAVTCTAD